MTKTSVCFVCNEYPPGPHGGIGTFTLVLARRLVEAGHDARVIGIYPPTSRAPAYEEDHGVRVWRMTASDSRMGWVRDRYQLFRVIAQWCRERVVDIVDVPDWEGWAAGWPKLPVPVVVRLNGTASYFAAELGRRVKRSAFWLERAALRRADYWCSVSRYTADKTRAVFGLKSDPAAILYNPVEQPPPAKPQQRNKTDVVFTGTLTEKKGVLSLVRAWPDVVRRCPQARLHIYGKDGRTRDGGSMQEHIASELAGHVERDVWLHGHVPRDRLFGHLEVARMAVFPSYVEAFALAPLEAMVRGCPTIYSKRGSGPELIEEERQGLLVDPDSPEEIANAVVRLFEDDQLATEFGRAGQQRVRDKFSVEAMVQKNEQFYQRSVEQFQAAK